MRAKPFGEMPLNERRAYLKAANDFFKPRLKAPFSDTKKKAADKQASNTKS